MRDLVLRFAERLRFPWLFAVTAGLFVADVIVPDFIPFVDEILLGLLTMLFGMWRKRRHERAAARRTPGSQESVGR
jgi:hypothetical protein